MLVFRQADSHPAGRVGKFSDPRFPAMKVGGFCWSNTMLMNWLVKVCRIHRFPIPWRGRMSCRGKALKLGQLFLMAMLIEEISFRSWNCVGVGTDMMAM